MNKITAKDIAKHLDLSPSTVSRALNNHSKIGEATKILVNKAALELGYHQPREGKLIGLIVPWISQFFIPTMIRGIKSYFDSVGYQLLILQSNNTLKGEKDCLRMCQRFKVDGILISVSKETNNADHFSFFRENQIKIVFLDHVISNRDGEEKLAKVRINDKHAAYTAMSYLIRRHHREILGIFFDDDGYITKYRKRGFFEAYKKHLGIESPSKDLVLNVKDDDKLDNNISERTDLIKKHLIDHPHITAIFAITDGLILNAIEATQAIDGRDISLIGISDGWLPTYHKHKITHIYHSGVEIGKEGAMYLHHLIEYPFNTISDTRVINTFLIEKDSVKDVLQT